MSKTTPCTVAGVLNAFAIFDWCQAGRSRTSFNAGSHPNLIEQRVASSVDTSGKTLAEWHHRKFRISARRNPPRVFSCRSNCHDQRNAVVPRNEQRWLAHEIRTGFGGLAALDARGVCNSARSYGAGNAGNRGCAGTCRSREHTKPDTHAAAFVRPREVEEPIDQASVAFDFRYNLALLGRKPNKPQSMANVTFGHALLNPESTGGFADQYQAQAAEPGVSPRMATVLKNIARSFAGLASQ